MDAAGTVCVRGQALPLRVRERLAAALSEAASADLDSLARLERDHRLGRAPGPQVSLYAELQPLQRGGEVSQRISPGRERAIRLPGGVEPARLGGAVLCRRHRRAGDERSA